MNKRNDEIKKVFAKTVKESRKAYVTAHHAEIIEMIRNINTAYRATYVEYMNAAEEKMEAAKNDPTMVDYDWTSRERDDNHYPPKTNAAAISKYAAEVTDYQRRIANIDEYLRKIDADEKFAAAEAYKLVTVEARMNAAQSKKNTFTMFRGYVKDEAVTERRCALDYNAHLTVRQGIADMAADAMEKWMKDNGFVFRRFIDGTRDCGGDHQYIRFVWED